MLIRSACEKIARKIITQGCSQRRIYMIMFSIKGVRESYLILLGQSLPRNTRRYEHLD